MDSKLCYFCYEFVTEDNPTAFRSWDHMEVIHDECYWLDMEMMFETAEEFIN